MELNETSKPASVSKYASEGFSISAGKTLTIETSPVGEDILSVEVPAGKQWEVVLTVSIVETDV